MNDIVADAVRHNTWATRTLIGFCRERSLTADQLARPAPGAFGSILATLNHLVRSDASYLRCLLDRTPAWPFEDEAGLDALASFAAGVEPLWEELLAGPIDAERVLTVDDGANEVHAGVFIAQALHHGTLHREQVCAALTTLGIEPPDLQAWEYAWDTGRLWERDISS